MMIFGFGQKLQQQAWIGGYLLRPEMLQVNHVCGIRHKNGIEPHDMG
jgi:hypothetical protein